jgi:putative hemolysin
MDSRFCFGLARNARQVAEARLLRSRVLEEEIAAALPACLEPVADDRHAEHCEHLIVADVLRDRVVGTCRILSPEGARRAAGLRAEQRFDLQLLEVLRHRMVEVEHACIDPDYPPGPVRALLWSALAQYLIERGHDYVMGGATLSVSDGGSAAASIYRLACADHLSPEDYRVFPRRRLPIENLCDTLVVSAPSPLKGFLDMGAWVCGEPAWDVEARCAELPILLPLARMHGRHARTFLARAA